MENASKALIMAGSVLIGVALLSMIVYLFTYFGGSVNEMNKQLEQEQIQQFNNQFTSYEAKGKTLTIYDILTVVNLAKENNSYYGLTQASDNNFYVTVQQGRYPIENMEESKLKENLKYELEDLKTTNDAISGAPKQHLKQYRCEVHLNPNTQRVNKIIFYDT